MHKLVAIHQSAMHKTKSLSHDHTLDQLTERDVGPTCDVRYCLVGPADRNSLLGMICQSPVGGSLHIHPCT